MLMVSQQMREEPVRVGHSGREFAAAPESFAFASASYGPFGPALANYAAVMPGR
jgi:hypothetical protein